MSNLNDPFMRVILGSVRVSQLERGGASELAGHKKSNIIAALKEMSEGIVSLDSLFEDLQESLEDKESLRFSREHTDSKAARRSIEALDLEEEADSLLED